MALISRDPFARTELHRTMSPSFDGRCSECGRGAADVKRRMYVYHTEHDGGRKDTHRGTFCSKGCHDAYHA